MKGRELIEWWAAVPFIVGLILVAKYGTALFDYIKHLR